jgi:hypothetical protein
MLESSKVKLGIHQPECFPWVGFFKKLYNCDEFIFLDDCQFEKNYIQNRNLFQNRKMESHWITLPASRQNSKSLLNQVYIKDMRKLQKIKKFFEIEYPKSIIKKKTNDIIESYCSFPEFRMINFNIDVINLIAQYLDFPQINKTFSSELKIDSSGSDRILNICLERKANIYLSGKSGKNYLDYSKFNKNGIQIIYLKNEITNPNLISYSAFQFSILHFLFKGRENEILSEIKSYN